MSSFKRCLFTPVLVLFAVTLCSCASQVTSNVPGPIDPDAATQEFTSTSSGVKYRILRQADGPKPSADDKVRVHYTGWLDDTTEFDTSYGRGPAEFRLTEVVKGWTEGLQHVNEGGMIELEIPSELGYGVSGRPGIPPNSTLHFKVELIQIL